MEKQDAVKVFREKGYEVELIDSVLMFYKKDNKPSYEEVKRIINDVGYDQSYGVSGSRNRRINEDDKIAG